MFRLPANGSQPRLETVEMRDGDSGPWDNTLARPSKVKNLWILINGDGMLGVGGLNQHFPHAMGDVFIARVQNGCLVDAHPEDHQKFFN